MGVGLETIFDIGKDETPYEAIYRCQLCGEEFVSYRTNREGCSDNELFERNNNQRHMCNNGDVGIATLIGFKYNPR